MQRSLLFTFVADDKPGIIDTLSSVVARHHGNWLTSRLTQLSGRFAGIVQINISEQDIAGLQKDLTALASRHIYVLTDPGTADRAAPDNSQQTMRLAVIGLDRPGIVREVAQALAAQAINVSAMDSLIESAAMTGEPLFKADLTIEMPATVALESLQEQLEQIADRLDIDWQLHAPESNSP